MPDTYAIVKTLTIVGSLAVFDRFHILHLRRANKCHKEHAVNILAMVKPLEPAFDCERLSPWV